MAECTDKNCYKHGSLKIRGQVLTGKVVSTKNLRTVTILVTFIRNVKKYARKAWARSKVMAHSPDCIPVEQGDEVRIGECRKVSKKKSWCVLEVVKKATTASAS